MSKNGAVCGTMYFYNKFIKATLIKIPISLNLGMETCYFHQHVPILEKMCKAVPFNLIHLAPETQIKNKDHF